MQRVSALWQASPNKLVGALFALALAAMMAVASGASFTSTSANTGNIVTAGILSHGNSKENDAILVVDGLAPGDSDQGTVTISNTGDVKGVFSLTKDGLHDSDPENKLSAKLGLVITDVTDADPANHVVRYNGKIGAMGIRPMGEIEAGDERTYEFEVTFPDGGKPSGPDDGDNLYKGDNVQVDYNWESVSD